MKLLVPVVEDKGYLVAFARRRGLDQLHYPLDEAFLADLEKMPPSAGIALGVDRLVMLAAGAATISQVVAFPEQ